MAATPLGLYDLLRPSFLMGFTIPAHIDRYLSVLGVDELRVAHDDNGIVYSGGATFVGDGMALPEREHRDPDGSVISFDESLTVDFRLFLSRDGAAGIDFATDVLASQSLPELRDLFDRFGPVEQVAGVPTEYPGIAFRLEILFNTITLHLSRKTWRPGKLSADHRIVLDEDRADEDVRFILPNMVFVYEQGDDSTRPPSFRLRSWGNSGFEAPADLAAGELVRMEPPIAASTSGRWGFGVDQVLIDLSADHTPPEILQFFGTDEAFEGLYVKEARLFYSDSDKDFGLNTAVRDLLISTAGEVSLEASIDLLFGPGAEMRVEVKIYDGKTEIKHEGATAEKPVAVPDTAVVQVHITGGVPTFEVSVKIGASSSNSAEIWDETSRLAAISPGAPATLREPGRTNLIVSVTDSTPGTDQQSFDLMIPILVRSSEDQVGGRDGAPADRPTPAGDPLPVDFTITQAASEGRNLLRDARGGTSERFQIVGQDVSEVRVKASPLAFNREDQSFLLDVPPGSDAAPIQIEVDWAAASHPDTFELLFHFRRPSDDELASFIADTSNADFIAGQIKPAGIAGQGIPALRNWLNARTRDVTSMVVEGHASLDDADSPAQSADALHDNPLSERRRRAALHIINEVLGAQPGAGTHHGHDDFRSRGNRLDRRVIITETVTAGVETLIATVSREQSDTGNGGTGTPPSRQPPQPPEPQNEKPNFLRRLGFRTRIERNIPSLLELSGQVDFETDLEETLRNATGDPSQTLDLQTTPEASQAPVEDGVVDFVLQVTHDTATFEWLERIQFGAAEADKNGLIRMTNARGNGGETRFRDTFGAVLTFAPVINESASEMDPQSAGDWAALGISLGVPISIGATGLFQTHAVTLYGGELQARQYIPPTVDATFNDAAVLFDYGVEFGLNIAALGIQTKKPLKVRYKALGFRLKFPDGVHYEPVFDTSRGYEIDLSDPSVLSLPSPLGDVLKLLSARIARFNPLTLEVDLGLKVDLGVVTVDRFKIKWPLDPLGAPMILPTGVKVDIPSTIIGSGSLNIRDDGLDGTLDVSLVPLKLRVAGSLGIQQLEDAATGREATGVFVGLVVDFPAPIVLGTSGLGLYGLSGLFGMHYKRLEPAAVEGDAAGPALRWLKLAEGEPSQLSTPGGVPVWGPEFDRWAFGVGALLGTTEGGFLANFRGAVVLELPGPRVLIFVKAQFLVPLPALKDDPDQLDAGLLGVLDLDFYRRQITIGMLVNMEIVDVIKIEVPIEVFFKLDDPSNWHVYLGTIQRPVSARVLNLVRGRGYFMVDGAAIANFPGPNGPITLPPIAVATGLEASLILGSEDIGLYLKVAAGAHMGVAFSPFFIVGRVYLSGELRLFIVSIEATGELSVEAPDPTIIHGEICGKVSFFFFSVKGCVGLTIGSGTHVLPAPPLVRNLYLQSFAPVLTAGQAGDRPIDGSLGDAVPPGGSADIPVVPIDSVPVLQLHASPLVGSASFFTELPGVSPDQTVGGWIEAGGGRRIRYDLKGIEIEPPLPASTATPPATWRTILEPGPKGAKTDIDLALFSHEPTATARALERSTELDGQVLVQWEGLCDPIAPPACVLWTFCDEKLGPSGTGWHRTGVAWPDPPGTQRGEPAPDQLYVEEAETDPLEELLGLGLYEAGLDIDEPARIIGANAQCGIEEPGQPGVCVTFPEKETAPNPLKHQGLEFLVRDFRGVPLAQTRMRGGLDCGHSLEITFPRTTRRVDLYLLTLSGRAGRVTAFNRNGSVVAKAEKPAPVPIVQLDAPGIHRIIVESPQDETVLFRLCYQGLPTIDIDRGEISAELVTSRRARHLVDSLRSRVAARHKRTELALRDTTRMIVNPELTAAPLSNFAELFRRHPRVIAPGELGINNPERLDPCCFRALELPKRIASGVAEPVSFADAGAIAERFGDKLFVTLHTNRAKVVRIYLAVSRNLIGQSGLRVRQLDGAGQLIRDDALVDLMTTPVTGVIGGLPDAWIDATGPWREQVLPVSTFLAEESDKSLVRLLLTLGPKENCERIQLSIPPEEQRQEQTRRALVGIVEVCSAQEEERAQNDEATQSGQIETATGFLQSDVNVPLLEPNRTYTIRVVYDAVTDPGDGSAHHTEANLEQPFRFRTDNRPPERLDPWVLATSPRHDDRYHFFEDPIRLIFNDDALLQLYEAYGRRLRVVIRAADGIPLPADRIETLDPVEAELSTPFRDFLEALVQAGLIPCVGEITLPEHASFTVPVTLRPLMDYTLDVELEPELTPIGGPDAAIVPLYRRSFSTGRFAVVDELIQAIVTRLPRHRALDDELAGFPAGPGVHILADQLIQDALVGAGETALPPANVPGITIYWVRNASDTHYIPHALLIDSPEPLWRLREEPVLETVPGQDDPAYQRIVPGVSASLEVMDQGGSRVARFVHSPAATRTLVILTPVPDPPATVPSLRLALRRPQSTLHQVAEQIVPLIELPLGAFAPWEEAS